MHCPWWNPFSPVTNALQWLQSIVSYKRHYNSDKLYLKRKKKDFRKIHKTTFNNFPPHRQIKNHFFQKLNVTNKQIFQFKDIEGDSFFQRHYWSGLLEAAVVSLSTRFLQAEHYHNFIMWNIKAVFSFSVRLGHCSFNILTWVFYAVAVKYHFRISLFL